MTTAMEEGITLQTTTSKKDAFKICDLFLSLKLVLVLVLISFFVRMLRKEPCRFQR